MWSLVAYPKSPHDKDRGEQGEGATGSVPTALDLLNCHNLKQRGKKITQNERQYAEAIKEAREMAGLAAARQEARLKVEVSLKSTLASGRVLTVQ